MGRFLYGMHATMAVVWTLLIIPSVIWWRHSVPYLVGISVYANVAGHFAAWMGARSERASNEGGD